jgi:ADP-heptose:LPS heptosyltransferase
MNYFKKVLRYWQRKIVNFLIELDLFFRRQPDNLVKTVLLVKPDGIGDWLLFWPTLKYYLAAFPDYSFSLLASTRNCELVRDLNNHWHYFKEIIILNKERFTKDFFYRRKICLNIFRKNFATVIYPSSWREPKCDIIIKASRARRKIVFSGNGFYLDWEKKAADAAYPEIIELPEKIMREIDKNKFFAEKICGVKVDYDEPKLDLFEENIFSASRLLQKFGLAKKKFAIIFPGAADIYRIWPLARFAEVIKYLLEHGIVPVMAGSKTDQELFAGISEFLSVKEKKQVVNFCGLTSILTLGAVLQQALFYFGSETGATHLAAAVGCPVVCLLGGGHFGRFFPYGNLELNRIVYDKEMKCRNDNWACAQKNKRTPAPCVAGIKTADAITEVNKLLTKIG